MSSLPKRLKYLKVIISELDKISPDDLNEDNEIALRILDEAFRHHVAGLDVENANEMIARDAELFFSWSNGQEIKSAGTSYVEVFFLGVTGSDFLGEAGLPSSDMPTDNTAKKRG